MVSEARRFLPRTDDAERLTARLTRRATIHQHLPRIERLLDDALNLDRELDLEPDTKLTQVRPWWETLAYDWRVSKLRSRRGRAPKINPRQVEEMVDKGMTYEQISSMLGVHRQSIFKAMKRDRGREL